MKLKDIIIRVQRQFGDDVQAQITKDDIVRWVNDACLEIASTVAINQTTSKGYAVLASGKSEYDLPIDTLLIRSVRANGTKLTVTTFDQINENPDYSEGAVGFPSTYWVYANKLYIYPTPVDSFAMGSLDIYYTKLPRVLLITDLELEPDIPTQFHPRIVEYCIAKAAELDDRVDQYRIKMDEFNSKVVAQGQNGEYPGNDATYPYITYVEV